MKQERSTTAQAINDWYIQNRRILPWRQSKDPYRIWLSEVMLQQTVVKVVIPYFEKFISEFPTVENLAAATEEKVLSLWSGLGYYSRARNLHQCAKQIAEQGRFPNNYNDLLLLKGVGPYTAAAIASIAYNQPVPVVDGNVIRVITRLFDINTDIQKKETQNKIQLIANKLIENNIPSIHNQAMMELGALVCTPKKPLCSLCPAQKYCKSFKNNTHHLRPVKLKKIKQEPWLWEVYIYKKGSKFAVVKNNNGTPWLNNLWMLPGRAKKLNAKPKSGWQVKHSITKHQIFVKITYKKSLSQGLSNIKWISKDQLKTIGTSSVLEKILNKEVL